MDYWRHVDARCSSSHPQLIISIIRQRQRPHNLHFHTCVYPTVALRRIYLSVAPPPRPLPPRSSIIIFTSYIKIITESRTDRAELKLKLEPVRVSHGQGQGHPLCWRAFICQTIQGGAGSIYHDVVVSGSLGLGFNHFISVCPAPGHCVGSIAPASACLELSYGF